jgi:hypothetical protein
MVEVREHRMVEVREHHMVEVRERRMTEVVEHHIDQEELDNPAEVEERHTGLAEGRHKASVGDIPVRAAVGHMGAGRSPAAEVEHHNHPAVEELRSHPAEAGSLLEAGIPGSALVEVGRMAAVAGMESLMVGGTGRNRAERIGLGMGGNRPAVLGADNTTC